MEELVARAARSRQRSSKTTAQYQSVVCTRIWRIWKNRPVA